MSGLLASRERSGALLLFGAAAVGWVVTVERMDSMDAGPGTDLGGLAWYAGVWLTMTAAMMLPSAVTRVVAVALIALGVWVAVSPSSVPGLTEPGMVPSMELMRRQ